ncbi:MAG: response regulator transcription factor [Verrucomicrobiae bacterium]|nr:response regulator transcription factor [Verrucomicrobiae bacterium]
MTPPNSRIALIEDHEPTRRHLEGVIALTPGLRVVGSHGSARRALEFLKSDKPDLVILDLGLPGMDGMECLTALRKEDAGIRVLILTIEDGPERIFEALRRGASSYLIKPPTARGLIQAIQETLDGGGAFSPGVARLMLDHFLRQGEVREVLAPLTQRERQVLEFAAEGLLPEEIARSVGISARTVGNHFHSMYHKLHVQTLAQAVAVYYRGGTGSHLPRTGQRLG